MNTNNWMVQKVIEISYVLWHNEGLTTPGKQFSASMLGPSNVWCGDPAELSELLSGLDGILLPTCINLAVINCNTYNVKLHVAWASITLKSQIT